MECLAGGGAVLVVIVAIAAVSDAFPAVISMGKIWLKQQHQLRLEEQKTRRLEALAKLDEPARAHIIATMPDWLDPEDEQDIEAWKKSRAEVVRARHKEGS